MINNNVRLIGRLGKDIEIKVAGQHKVAQVSLAVRKSKDDSEWFYVNVWDNQAEFLERFAKKGTTIAIDGKLDNYKYTDNNGKNHNMLQINASEVTILAEWKKADKTEIINIEKEELPFY